MILLLPFIGYGRGHVTPLEVLLGTTTWLVSGPVYAACGAFTIWLGPSGMYVRQGRRSVCLRPDEIGFVCLLMSPSGRGGKSLRRVLVYDRTFEQRLTCSLPMWGWGRLIRRLMLRYHVGWVDVIEDDAKPQTFTTNHAPSGAIAKLREDGIIARARER